MLMAGEEETIAHFRFEMNEFGVFAQMCVGGGMKVLPTFDNSSKGIVICIANYYLQMNFILLLQNEY